MEGADLLTAGVLFLFAAVAAVPLAAAGHRRGARVFAGGNRHRSVGAGIYQRR